MDLRTQINAAYKEAMQNRNTLKRDTLRLILAAIKDQDIQIRAKGAQDKIEDEAIELLLQKMIKQRKDSIEMYQKGGRDELAEREQNEIDIIQNFLPKALSEAERNGVIDQAIKTTGAKDLKDIGKVMGILKGQYAAQLDMSEVSKIVKGKLGR